MSIFKGMIGRNIGYLKTQLRDQAIGGVDIVKMMKYYLKMH